ncbi:MAG: hypothetical protein DUD39_09810 [Coriobacteriaceae bacterium]|nr:MAG: hypothetical protein DUD39_09810 [Coriobacteriaceae bacterium]
MQLIAMVYSARKACRLSRYLTGLPLDGCRCAQHSDAESSGPQPYIFSRTGALSCTSSTTSASSSATHVFASAWSTSSELATSSAPFGLFLASDLIISEVPTLPYFERISSGAVLCRGFTALDAAVDVRTHISLTRTRVLAASARLSLDFGTGVPLSAAVPLVSLGPQDLHDGDTVRFCIASTSDSYQTLSAGNSPLKATSAHGI